MPYQGHLDQLRGRDLVGWVYDPSQPGHRAHVQILLDGAPLRTRIASNFRPDLKQAGIGDGFHAFSIELPQSVLDGSPHRIEVAIDNTILLATPYQSIYQGAIDDISPQTIRFHLQDTSQPGLAVTAELYADGRFLTQGPAPQVTIPRGFDISLIQRLELRARGCPQTVAEWNAPPPKTWQPLTPVDGPVDVLVNGTPGHTTITAMLRTLESIAASSNESVAEVYAECPGLDLAEASRRLGFRLGAPAAGSGHDLVLLAVGTLVHGSWLDRLRAAAYLDADIATVSPLASGPIDGHTFREIDALVSREQSSSYAIIDHPSEICVYRRAVPGELHLLAGGVRVEALHPTRQPEDRNPEAARLRRLVEELRLPPNPTAQALPDGTLLVEGLRYEPDKGIPYEVEIRDYGWICPRGDLIDETGRYCGEPAIEACERCLRNLGPGDGLGGLLHRAGSVAELREQSRRILEGASRVTFPSQDSARRIARYCTLPSQSIRVLEEPGTKSWAKPSTRPLRILRLGPETNIWQACLWDATKRNLPLEFVTYGEAHAEWIPSEEPLLRPPAFTRYPIQFDIGAVAAGALRIPCGLPASRINNHILEGLA